jgi:septum formation protein
MPVPKKTSILLASSSERRRELLEAQGISFSTIAADVDERAYDHLPPKDRVIRLATEKARAVAGECPIGTLILAADTLVCDPTPRGGGPLSADSSGHITLGKPQDRNEARRMIESLEGTRHHVHTGLVGLVAGSGLIEAACSSSTVSFSSMGPDDIEEYLDTGEWIGVAGAYRIQGKAARYISRLEGSWSGVVGLPIHELYVILSRLGVELRPLA